MKKILLFMFAMLMTVAASAQVELGAPSWNIKDGQKISLTKSISLSFPNAAGVTAESVFSVAGNIIAEGEVASDDNAFDGLDANIANAVEIVLSDIIEVQPSTNYTLQITSVLVDGTEALTEPFSITFKTRGAERKISWTFTMDQASSDAIKASIDAESRMGTYWWDVNGQNTFPDYTDSYTTSSSWNASNNDLRYYTVKRNDEPLVLPDGSELPMTEDLTFNVGNKKLYVGEYSKAHKDRIAFNSNNLYMTVPDCKVGDVITINANRATKATASKFTCIVAMNGAAEAVDGLVSSSGNKDSLQLGSSFANFKFKVLEDGDLTFKFSNALVKSLEITEALPVVDCTYKVVAAYKDGDNVKELKTLIPETVGKTMDVVKVNYSYWLKDDEGNLYTHGAKGSEFVEALDLMSDTTFYINYTKANISGVVFLAEGEDFFDEDATERTIEKVTQANAVIRSSMGKAAYATADTKITTLPAGTYMFKAIIFDNKGSNSGFTQNIGISSNTEEDLVLAANADNWTEAEQIFTLNNESDIIWRAGGSDSKGIDIMVIYATDELPEDPDGVATVEANETVAKAVRKVVKNGQLLIENANGAFTVAGAQVK